jgi:hypothetical protein
MTTWDDRTLLEDIIARGIDDWVYAAEVHDIAARTGLSDPEQLRMLAVGLIAEALVQGLLVAGDYDGVEHRPWSVSVGEAIARIAEDWLKWGNEVPTPGAIVWLDLTPAGREIAEAVIAREQQR